MKKIFVLCAVLSMVFGISVVQAGTNPKGKPFVSINDQIVEVSGAVTTIQDQIDLLVGVVGSLEERVGSNEDGITNLEIQNQALTVLSQSNLTSINGILDEIAFINQDIVNLRADIALNAGDTVALEVELNEKIALKTTLEDAMVLVDSKLISLEGSLALQIGNNLTLIEALQADIDTVNEKLAAKQNMIEGRCPDGEAVIEVYEDGSLACGAAGAGVSGNLQMMRVYTTSGDVPRNVSVKLLAYCPSGWVATGTGINYATGWDIEKSSTEGPAANGVSWGVVQATNKNISPDWFTAVANCISIAP